MNAFLLSLLLWTQGIPVQPTQTGTVTGVLRTTDGRPAVNERVTAIPQVEFAGDAADGATLSSLAVTDEQGRYTLENIPPGRYYIAAGRLDLQTYYPGTQAMNAGLPVQIAPGAKLEKIDFTLNSTSAGRSLSSGFGSTPAFIVPLDIRIENGGKVPLSSGGKFTAIKLTSVTGSVAISAPLDGGISLPPGSADYRITFEGLPADYRVKTMNYGATALSDGLLKITNAAPVNTGNIVTAVFTGNNLTTVFSQILGLTGIGGPGLQPQTLSIVFETGSVTPVSGARVSGNIRGNLRRVIYLSGIPGTVFTDGSFEFRNVVPGRHVIMTVDNPPATQALVASVVVGTGDLSGVEVSGTAVLPLNPRTPAMRIPSSTQAPGVLPLATLRGRVFDAETGTPLKLGTVFVVGDSFARYELGAEGTFEFQRLLPGNYDLEIQGVGYPTFRRSVVIEDQDVDLELKAG